MEERTQIRVISSLVYLLTLVYSSTTESHVQPGDPCEMGGGVKGTCEDIFHCLETGGVVRREGRVNVCWEGGVNIHVCCRRPHLVARELCNAWSHYLRRDEGRCDIEHPLIYGGEEANIGEFPHALSISLTL
ncbi:uncharacterized protein [Palaemon carinicauda]|uniref:uncharacterized protein n=1 Tax=Palaemon carinicauda TaxID=392227 RepID=UPI0035B63C0E